MSSAIAAANKWINRFRRRAAIACISWRCWSSGRSPGIGRAPTEQSLARLSMLGLSPWPSVAAPCVVLEEFENLPAAKVLTRMHQANYNQDRPHSSLDYMTPAEFARQCSVSVAGAPETEHCRKNDETNVNSNQPVLS